MKLTGKCKETFEKWHREQTPEMGHWYSIVNFNGLVDSMKFGVYQDFFEEKGIIIDIQPFLNYNNDCYTEVSRYCPRVIVLNSEDTYEENVEFINLNKARDWAVNNANERYNEK